MSAEPRDRTYTISRDATVAAASLSAKTASAGTDPRSRDDPHRLLQRTLADLSAEQRAQAINAEQALNVCIGDLNGPYQPASGAPGVL